MKASLYQRDRCGVRLMGERKDGGRTEQCAFGKRTLLNPSLRKDVWVETPTQGRDLVVDLSARVGNWSQNANWAWTSLDMLLQRGENRLSPSLKQRLLQALEKLGWNAAATEAKRVMVEVCCQRAAKLSAGGREYVDDPC